MSVKSGNPLLIWQTPYTSLYYIELHFNFVVQTTGATTRGRGGSTEGLFFKPKHITHNICWQAWGWSVFDNGEVSCIRGQVWNTSRGGIHIYSSRVWVPRCLQIKSTSCKIYKLFTSKQALIRSNYGKHIQP